MPWPGQCRLALATRATTGSAAVPRVLGNTPRVRDEDTKPAHACAGCSTASGLEKNSEQNGFSERVKCVYAMSTLTPLHAQTSTACIASPSPLSILAPATVPAAVSAPVAAAHRLCRSALQDTQQAPGSLDGTIKATPPHQLIEGEEVRTPLSAALSSLRTRALGATRRCDAWHCARALAYASVTAAS